MKSNQDDEPLLDNSPTDELPVLSEHDVVEDFDRTSVFVSLHEDTGRHYTAHLPAAEQPDDAFVDTLSRIEHGGTDTYRVQSLHENDLDRLAATVNAKADRRLPGEVETLQAKLEELNALYAQAQSELADRDASIASLEERLEATRQAVARRDATEQQLRARLTELDEVLAEGDRLLAERDGLLAERDALLARRAALLSEADARLAGLKAELEERDLRLIDRELRLTELSAMLAARDLRLSALDAELADRKAALAAQEAESAARDAELASRRADLADRDADLASRDSRIAALVADLASRDSRIAALVAELASRDARLAVIEAEQADRDLRLAAQEGRLPDREADPSNASLPRAVAMAEAAAAHRSREAGAAAAPRSGEAGEARQGSQAGPGAPPKDVAGENRPAEPDALLRSREEAAALASYIENRRAHWDDLQQRLEEQRERMSELELELEQRASRQREAVQRAEAEARRVEDLKAEVGKLRLLLDARRRDHGADSSRGLRVDVVDTSTHEAAAVSAQPPSAAEGAEAGAERADLQAQLDELHSRVAARDAALDERAEQQDQLRQRLAENQTQLDQARKAVGRLERIVIERDRALDAKKARIDSLQAELTDKLGAAHGLVPDTAGPAANEGAAEPEASRTISAWPSMVCLTSDAPHSYPLRKAVVTIGRSSQCDIQIATAFVSREHARISRAPEGLVIEDLGSKNGVFVNSVRVEREPLQHGDLLTIGETQFRFLRE